jgi:hypothetical protein
MLTWQIIEIKKDTKEAESESEAAKESGVESVQDKK